MKENLLLLKDLLELKKKCFKHMTAINQNISFDALNDIVDKYNNAVHKLLK